MNPRKPSKLNNINEKPHSILWTNIEELLLRNKRRSKRSDWRISEIIATNSSISCLFYHSFRNNNLFNHLFNCEKAEHHNVKLKWIPSHSVLKNHQIADMLTSDQPFTGSELNLQLSFVPFGMNLLPRDIVKSSDYAQMHKDSVRQSSWTRAS